MFLRGYSHSADKIDFKVWDSGGPTLVFLRGYSHITDKINFKVWGHLAGTTYDKHNKRWRSQIQLNGKQITIGYYLTQQEAHEAYLKALEKINQVLTK